MSLRHIALAGLGTLLVTAVPVLRADQTPPAAPQKPAVFRVLTNLVRVDVVVRDKNGEVVKGLKDSDFIVAEDGKAQQVTSFDFQEIATEALPALSPTSAVLSLDKLQSAAAQRTVTVSAGTSAPAAAGGATPPPVAPLPEPTTPSDLSNRRMVILLFDTSSMQPDEVDRAVKSANKYIDEQMSPADLVSLASVGQTLTILRDFTADRTLLKAALAGFDSTSGTGFEQPVAADVTDDTTVEDPADLPLDDSEFGIFNNDRRLRAMRVLCEAMAPIEQKKALLYFSSGMSRSGSDNQVELRAVTNTCNKSNTSIYPVDSRGLTAVVPGGAAGGRGGGGRGGGGSSLFSGRSMVSAYSSLNASQETLSTLAADTGGQAFLDSNDFGPAFTRVQRDMSAYYLLGYSSNNAAKDGKFRKIQVRLKNATNGYRVEARTGYYANVDFAHLAKVDREKQLQEEISSAVSSTDLPVVATTSWFRVANDKFYVPLSLAVPGSAVRVPTQAIQDRKNATIDLLGVVTDEQGRVVGRIRDTMQIPATQAATLADKQLQYQSGVTLPAGHYNVKIAVRENADGTMGTFEFPIAIPDLKTEQLKVSPIVLSTQLRFTRGGGPGPRGGGPGGEGGRGGGPGGGGPPGGFQSQRGGGGPQWSDTNSINPLLRNGQEIVQSLSHVVTQAQRMYFYFEVYDPTLDTAAAPKLQASLAFYRGRVKVFETPIIDKTEIDAPERKASVFQLQLPAADFKPGLYTCQVNIVDEVSGKFAFPRIAVYVKEK